MFALTMAVMLVRICRDVSILLNLLRERPAIVFEPAVQLQQIRLYVLGSTGHRVTEATGSRARAPGFRRCLAER